MGWMATTMELGLAVAPMVTQTAGNEPAFLRSFAHSPIQRRPPLRLTLSICQSRCGLYRFRQLDARLRFHDVSIGSGQELQTADIPGIMMRESRWTRRCKDQRRYEYLSQNLHCNDTRTCFYRLACGPTRSCTEVQRHAWTFAFARQVRESERKCPRLFPYCDVDRSFYSADTDPSLLQLSTALCSKRICRRGWAGLAKAAFG
jgi:hypothetical protein